MKRRLPSISDQFCNNFPLLGFIFLSTIKSWGLLFSDIYIDVFKNRIGNQTEQIYLYIYINMLVSLMLGGDTYPSQHYLGFRLINFGSYTILIFQVR